MVNLRTEDFTSRTTRNNYGGNNDVAKSYLPMQKRTASYDKHYLSHTDTTGGGLGYSYPHKKDFAWNLLFLKQSWGVGLKQPENKASATANHSPKSYENGASKKMENSSSPRKASTAPNLELPQLTPKQSASSSKRSKRRTAGQSRTTLDSIPEDKIISVLSKPETKSPMTSQRKTKRHRTTSSRTGSHRSRASESRNSGVTSSLLSSDLPSMASESRNSSVSATTMTSRGSYESRASSGVTSRATRWDEHEGRPAVEKMFRQQRSRGRVVRTVGSDVMEKTAVGPTAEKRAATTEIPLNNNAFSQRKYQPFTNLSFTIENAANKTRLRSSLYKTTEATKKPTLFRGDNAKPNKPFNPKYHSDITRPVMVDSHAHKHAPEGYAPPKWFPSVQKSKGPWTTYKH